MVAAATGVRQERSCTPEHATGLRYIRAVRVTGLLVAATAIAAALAGLDVLSVAAVASDVPRGIVLGFEVASGKPKLVIHLTCARRQNVAFKPGLLRLARVIE